MFDRAYRQRLEADLTRWEADGVITPAAGGAIRNALPPLTAGTNIPVVVGIVGGLLIAAAFLAFIAAHWTELARLLRFAIVAAGIVVANGLGAWFARTGRPVLADLCASIGAVIFGAGIALVGQMYHLGEDFAGGMLLWAIGALAAAVLTGSRGALAVALVAACIWSSMRVYETQDVPHLAFIPFWVLTAGLALAWQSRVAAHLVAIAALPWWIAAAVQVTTNDIEPIIVVAGGAALLLGGGIALAGLPWQGAKNTGPALAAYGAFALAIVAVLEVLTSYTPLNFHTGTTHQLLWANACGVAGAVLALAAAGMERRAGPAFAAGAIALVLVAASLRLPQPAGEPWLAYAVELCAMICLVVAGMLDAVRARIVAGWLGIAGVIATITWVVNGSLLHRSAFLAVAGAVAIALAMALNRLLPGSAP